MVEHPGIVFRDGPTGRRAGLAGGPDVWEVMRAIVQARSSEPSLGERGVLELVEENSGLSHRSLRTALDYWARFPDEIDAEIAAANDAERAAEIAWQRERHLLAG